MIIIRMFTPALRWRLARLLAVCSVYRHRVHTEQRTPHKCGRGLARSWKICDQMIDNDYKYNYNVIKSYKKNIAKEHN